MLIKIFFNNITFAITTRKLFGVYYHSLIKHAPEQYRIVSGRTSNTEKEEATFSHIKRDTNNASNHHADNVISNAIIRHQARKVLTLSDTEINNKESDLHKLYKNITPKLNNTLISFKWIKEYPFEYQCLLERQADYLLEKNVWWTESNTGVEFRDKHAPNDSKLFLHHYRSSTVKDEITRVKECWDICLQNKHELIPAYKIKVYDITDTTYELVILKTLHHFQKVHITMSNDISSINEVSQSNLNQSNNTSTITSSLLLNASVDFSPNMPDLLNLSEIPITNSKIIESLESSDKFNNITPSVSTPVRTLKQNNSINHTEDILTFNNNTVNCATTQMSSTPTQPKSSRISSKENDIISIKPKKVDSNETNNSLSKSSNMLLKIFGSENIIFEFDKARKNLKNNASAVSKSIYRVIVAKLEVKLTLKYDELREHLKKFELENLKKSSHLNTVPTNKDDQESYNNLLKQLKYIKMIKYQLSDEH